MPTGYRRDWRDEPTSVRFADFRRALLAMIAADRYDNEFLQRQLERMDATHSIPGWMLSISPNPTCRWKVRHRGMTHETNAVSEADAINNVRYRIYGAQSVPNWEFDARSPDAELYELVRPFIGDALCYFNDNTSPRRPTAPTATISKDEMRDRLARMRMNK